MILTVPHDSALFPTLGPGVCDWIERELCFGPGDLRGQPAVIDDEKRALIYRMYEVFPKTDPQAGRRRFKRAALSMRKGTAKTEFSAWLAAAELHPAAPVRFDRWEYDKALRAWVPIGKGVVDPFVVLMAYTEEQSDELAYGALKTILEESAIGKDFDIGLERILRKDGAGKAVSLAGSPNARDGARTTFQCFDEPLALDTVVPTTEGWKTIGEIQPGHSVYGRDGSPVCVLGVSDVKVGRPCYRMTFDDGDSVVTDEAHVWTVVDWRNRPRGEHSVTTGEMFRSGLDTGYGFRWRLPRAHGYTGVHADLPIEPYLLGAWLGDGATDAGYIHNAPLDYPLMSVGIPHTVSRDANTALVRWLPTGLRSRLRGAGLLGCKHIPEPYFFASREQRLSLLRGLMDTDGHTTARGNCTFVQKHRALCEDVALLVRSLGSNASIAESVDARSRTGHMYKVHFSPDFIPFALPRKVNTASFGQRKCVWWPAVVDIQPVDSVPVRCIGVDSDDHLFLIGRGLHLTHNTHRMTSVRLKQAHQTMMANLPKRKLADAWALETTTAPEPGAGSIAEATMDYAKAIEAGTIADAQLYYFHRQAGDEHDLTTKDGARAAVIEASGPTAAWSDIDAIVGLWNDPTTDRAYWERVYCNRLVKGGTQAFDVELWKTRTRAGYRPSPGALITIGFDGALFFDSTGIVCTEVETGFQWKAGVWERPASQPKDKPWKVPTDDVDRVMRVLFDDFEVWRLYADPPHWQSTIAAWRGEWGEERVIEWWTNRDRQMTTALEGFTTAIIDGVLSHDGDPDVIRHLGNARKRELPRVDEEGKKAFVIQKERPDSPHKMDLAMAACLSWEARTDAIAAGATKTSQWNGEIYSLESFA